MILPVDKSLPLEGVTNSKQVENFQIIPAVIGII